MTSPKGSCGRGECGACTVLVDGVAVLSCVTPDEDAVGTEVCTAAGVTVVDPGLARAFAQAGAFQCGFCTPGQIVRAAAVLGQGLPDGDAELARAMSGNICRCTGYAQILDAVRAAGSAP